MISDSNKKLAQWAMDYALQNGCQQAKVDLSSGSNSSFELRDAKMDRLQQASENQLTLSVYVDGRYGMYSTNRLDKKELESFIKNGIDATRYLAKDEARMLPDASRYYQGGKPDLQLTDTKLSSLNPDDKVLLAKTVAEEVLGKNERIISVDSSYSDGESSSYKLASNGFEGESNRTWFSLSAGVSIKGEGEARPSDGWYESAIYYDKLIKSDIGKTALERTLRKLGQKKVKSGKYTRVVDSLNSSQLLRPVLSALYGSALQ
ncbi:MAG: TldD/PmbA family protein, partial [Bacteroides sp.]